MTRYTDALERMRAARKAYEASWQAMVAYDLRAGSMDAYQLLVSERDNAWSAYQEAWTLYELAYEAVQAGTVAVDVELPWEV